VDSFAVKTRQGFIPSQAKPNQDSFISVKNLSGIEGLWMFGVCDGHGINGHLVSDFVKKNLPKILGAMFVQVIGGSSSGGGKKSVK
jgi:serine/threonine protein phosphatase PrpC